MVWHAEKKSLKVKYKTLVTTQKIYMSYKTRFFHTDYYIGG